MSRQQFWDRIDRIRSQRPGMSVIVVTTYMEEAERFDWLAAMSDGKVIATGTPAQVRQQAGQQTLERTFVALLPEAARPGHRDVVVPPRAHLDGPPAVQAIGLTRRYGDFTAVDRVNFQIGQGEIFGFLGSNDCGKTATMKMLTGLLPASEGQALLFGEGVDASDTRKRKRVGYMSQSFSLYSELTVRHNLVLHAELYPTSKVHRAARVSEMLETFDLAADADQKPDDLPLGIRQRLQLAAAVIHAPEVLILDEPTSGVDPVARDAFWQHLIGLSRNDGVTIFVSTHFMNEAMRCDRISLMHAGRVLVVGTPAEIVAAKGAATLNDAFISYLRAADGTSDAPRPQKAFAPAHLWAFALRELMEILSDPPRLTFAFLGPIILMLTFG